jgi:hypothetical protein
MGTSASRCSIHVDAEVLGLRPYQSVCCGDIVQCSTYHTQSRFCALCVPYWPFHCTGYAGSQGEGIARKDDVTVHVHGTQDEQCAPEVRYQPASIPSVYHMHMITSILINQACSSLLPCLQLVHVCSRRDADSQPSAHHEAFEERMMAIFYR